MACKYWVNDQWLTESQLKKVLSDGLLDQLVANENFIIPGFNVNTDFIEAQKGVDVGPVKLAVTLKVDKQLNQELDIKEAAKGQVIGTTTVKTPRNNPLKVINDSNTQIKSENKRLGTNRKPNQLILVTKIKGELKYGNAHPDIIKSINESKRELNIKENMQEGKVYMLVPSAYGMYPIWLRNGMLGETKVAEQVKLSLKTLFESKNELEIVKAKRDIEKYLYQVTVDRTPDGVNVKIKKEDSVVEDTTFGDLTDLTTHILGKYDKRGNYTGELNEEGKRIEAGRIARTNHFAFNDSKNTLSNEFYANNGFISTDVFSEGGNFFNSSSFIVEAYQASAKNKKMLSEVLADPKLAKSTQTIEENKVAQKITKPEVKDQSTKKGESLTFSMKPKDIKPSNITEVPSNVATRHINMPSMKVMTPTSTTQVQAIVTSELIDGKLTISSVTKRVGIKEKGSAIKWSVAEEPFTSKQKNTLTQAFFKDEVVTKFKEELAAQEVVEEITDHYFDIEDRREKELDAAGLSESKLEKGEVITGKQMIERNTINAKYDAEYDIEFEGEITEEQQSSVDSAFDNTTVPIPEDDDVDGNLFAGAAKKAENNKLNSLFQMGESENGENLDMDAKPRMTFQKEDATKWNQEEEIGWLQKKIGDKVLDGKVFSTIEDLKDYLPEQTYELLLHARKNGEVLHGVFTKAAMHLNENAYEGTGYHEAFHVVFNLALPLAQRLALLEEAIETFDLPANSTYIQIEEVLADKFMEYVQTAEASSPTLGQKVRNFFKALFRGMKLFFNRNSKITIEGLFNDIQLGIYKNKANFKNTDLTKIDPEMVRFMRTNQSMDAHTQLDPNVELQAIRYMEYKFLHAMEQAVKDDKAKVEGTDKLPSYHGMSDSEIIANIGVRKMYGLMLKQILDDRAANAGKVGVTNLDNIIKILTDNGNSEVIEIKTVGGKPIPMFKDTTPLLEKFTRSLRKFNYNIDLSSVTELNQDLREETSLTENVEESTFEERWQRSHIEINPQDTISQKVKRNLGTIPKMRMVKGVQIPTKNMFGAPEVYSEREVFGYIGQRITDSQSPTQMIEKLKSLQTDKAFIPAILNEIERDLSFKTALWTTLASKTFQRFITVYEKDGEYQTFYSNRKGIDDIIKETLIANFLVDGSKLFGTHKRNFLAGQTNFEDIKLEAVAPELARIEDILKRANVENTKDQLTSIINDLSKFLTDNNINITPEQIHEIWNPQAKDKNNTSWKNVIKVIQDSQKIFTELANGRNPFLDMKPIEQLTKGGKVKTYAGIIEGFARKLKPAMEKEVVLSFRNADNKTVYSIQYSNYLSKLITNLKSKESLDEHLEKIKDDPLLSRMPIFSDLMDEEGTPTRLMDEMQITIFDGLARQGKSTSVEYSRLSDIELEAVSMGAFYNQGNNHYGYYRLPIPSDSGTAPFIKYKKFTNEEVVDRLVKVGIAETERINNSKRQPKDSLLRKVKNYFEQSQKYQILSFLNGNIDPAAVTEDELRGLIVEHLEGDFLELQKKTHKNAGIITSYAPGKNGKIVFADKVITSKKQGTSNEFYTNYLYNQYYVNTQMTTVFAGDPSFYKNTTDYQKRYKQIISPGSLPNADIVDPEFNAIILADEKVPSSDEVVKGTIQMIKNSDMNPDKKKELISLWESKSETAKDPNWNDITDAATFVSIDRMMQVLESFDRVTPAHEAAAVRIANGTETTADAALFNVVKPFMFTKRYINGVEVPIQVKNSEMLLTKAFAQRKDENGKYKYPKLVEAHRILTEGVEKDGVLHSVDSIIFESAVKVGQIGNSHSTSDDIQHSKMVTNSDGTYSLDVAPEIVTFQHSDWRIQQETPAHYEDESGNYGTQLRNLIISDMDLNGDYTINGRSYKGSEVAALYQSLIAKNLESSFESVKSMFEDTDGDIDYAKLIEHLKKEMEDRGLDQEYFDAIAPVVNPETGKIEPTLPLWHPLIAYKVESLINSIFKNRITKQKINGGNMVNATSFGTSQSLNWHIDENGNYHVEALLPWWSKKYFPKDSQGNVNIDNVPDALKNLIAYRIPTEDKYSIFNIKVVGFTDSAAGGAIILPAEATFQAGLDFDIDKMFMIIPAFRKNNEGKAEYIQYIHEDTSKEKIAEIVVDSSQSYESFLEKFIPEEKRDTWRLKKELADDDLIKIMESEKDFVDDTESLEIKEEIASLKKQRDLEQDKDASAALTQQIRELNNELRNFATYSNAADKIFEVLGLSNTGTRKLQAEIVKILEEQSNKNIDYDALNNTKSRNNRLLEIMTGIMENKHTALSIVDPGNFDQLKATGSKTRIQSITADSNSAKIEIKKKGLKVIKDFRNDKISVLDYRDQINELADQLDDQDFNINYPSTQLTLFRRNMTGKALIGIFANHNVHHAKAQFTSLRTDVSIFFDTKSYSELNQSIIDGTRVSKGLASMLAAVVDNAKDPISSYLNMNTYTADLISFMTRLGVNEDTIFAFVNQPVIVNLTNQHFNEKGSLSEQKGIITKLKKSWKAKMITQGGFTETEIETLQNLSGADLNLNLDELENALDQNGTKEYYATQYKVLEAFDNYYKTSAELSAGVQATRVDTKGVGPTYGDNYAMVNRQAKLLEKREPRLIGIEQMLYQSSDQVMNPAFNTYGWIGPISIMNKIFPSIGSINENGEIAYSMLGRIKNFFSDLKDQSYTISEKEARQIDTSFMTYLGSGMPFFKYGNAEEILNKVPEELIKYKAEHPDSPFSPLLEQLYTRDADKQVEVRRIVFYNTGKSSIDNESARLSWKMMLTSEDAATKNLALNLVKYAYFSNGYAFGPFSFFNLIPVNFWTDSYAKAPENKNIGMLDSKGRTFNQMMKVALTDIERSTTNADTIIRSEFINRFVMQFAQNTAEKSMIIKTVDSTDASDRKYAPVNVPRVLAENEVFVFPSTNLGTHNIGQSGWAYAKTPNYNPAPGIKGQKGEWAEYGTTGKEMQGTDGRGFALRAQTAEVKDGKVLIKQSNQLTDNGRVKQMDELISDLKKLAAQAGAKPGVKYTVGNLHKGTGWSRADIIRALNTVMEELDLPNNIILPKEIEVRDFGIAQVKVNQILTLHKPSILEYNPQILIKGDQFPSFLKTSYKGEVKLFKLISGSDTVTRDGKIEERPTVYYKRLPLLSLTNFVSSYDFFNDITESIVPNLTKKVAKEEEFSEYDLLAQAESQFEADLAMQEESIPTADDLKSRSKWVMDPADVSDVSAIAKLVAIKNKPTPGKVSFEDFLKLVTSKGVGHVTTKEEWDSQTIDVQNTTMEQIKNC